MRRRTSSKPRSGVVEKYYKALCDLRDNPCKYAQQEWCKNHNIGHSAGRALIHLGHAEKVNGKLKLVRERITNNLIHDVVRKKREYDNLRQSTHGAQLIMEPIVIHEPAKEEQRCDVHAVEQVGLIRRFFRWIY